MSAHTPGPWSVKRDPSHFDTASTVIGGEETQNWPHQRLMVQVGGACPVKEQEANARLIAAAPELLEALLVVTNTDDHADPEVRAIVRAAIAKAKGGAA